jgi:chlorite dismutase
MTKRRGEEHNWYDLPFEERAEHMEAHGDIGRDYGGRVVQMITGAIALDDWEWGVTLWGDDLVDMKDLLYEMRFDSSTSRYAEFGSFYVGRRFLPADLPALLSGEQVPTAGDRDHEVAAGGPVHPADATPDGADRSEHATGGGHADETGDTHHANEAGDTHHANEAGDTHHDGEAAESHHPGAGDAHHPEASGSHPGGESGGSANGGEEAPRAHAGSEDATEAHGHGEATGESGREADAGGGADAGGAPPQSGGADIETRESDDLVSLLATLGLHRGEEYEPGDYGLVLYSDADAKELQEEVDGLRGNFEHYDSHVSTTVRAQSGRSAVVSIWDAERAADTALGFLTDLPGVSESVRGPLGEAETTSEAHGGDGGGGEAAESSESIREALADLDVYAGQPHGEDVYALVLYSQAPLSELKAEVAELADGFGRYDTHEGTAVYEDPNSGTAAVVSLWETADAADTAGEYLEELPGVVGRADDTDGFGTMGMFYTVDPDYREEFVETFGTVRELLNGMAGHRETALLFNTDNENDMFIASQWDSREDAMAFFRSEEFADTVDWGRDVLVDKPRHVFLA